MSEKIEKVGVVTDNLRDGHFKIELEDHDKEIMGHISGSIRRSQIEIVPGDEVRVEISPYDLEKGRIIRRL